MVIKASLIDEIPVGNMLGEGIQWNAQDRAVWWSDILGLTLYRMEWPSRKLDRFEMPEPLASFAFCENTKAGDNIILAAFASGFAFHNLDTRNVQWIHRLEFLAGEGRLNDGRVDRQGRFWCGTMMANPGDGSSAAGRLFCIDTEQKLTVHENNVHISNGLCWSPDNKVMYFADSLLGKMYRYDFDAQSGAVSNRSTFSQSIDGGSPDGANVDASGNIWSAHWGIGVVRIFNPAGDMVTEIETPATQPSCIAFGGENLDVLFVTSAKEGMSDSEMADNPSAGHIFVYETNVSGLPEAKYDGVMS